MSLRAESLSPPGAQFQEDFALLRLFGADHKGFFLDIGANDGLHGSNTYLLEQHGWKGILIEASPGLAATCQHTRPGSIVVNKAVVGDPNIHTVTLHEYSSGLSGERFDALSSVGGPSSYEKIAFAAGAGVTTVEVSAARLDDILLEHGVTGRIDFMSIDVEGSELDVLRGFSFDRYRPRVILVEDNSFGSDLTISNYLDQVGYQPVCRSFVNVWYCAKHELPASIDLSYSLLRYLQFKALASRLHFTQHRFFFREIHQMILAEHGFFPGLKFLFFRITPVWFIESLLTLYRMCLTCRHKFFPRSPRT
jgi:FkbM family methyltransferase